MGNSSSSDKVYTYLGFAAKSKNIKAGEQAVLASLKRKQAYLLIIASDASESAIKRWVKTANLFEIPYSIWGEQVNLGNSIGQSPKTIVSITDENFYKTIKNNLTEVLYGKNQNL